MAMEQLKELLEAGVHFGHQTRRWNPKMRPFIFTARNGIYIIDLNKTVEAINQACRKVKEVIGRGQLILFVGTKKQAKDVLKDEAIRCGQYFVTERWLGGMLTNFSTIKASIKKLKAHRGEPLFRKSRQRARVLVAGPHGADRGQGITQRFRRNSR